MAQPAGSPFDALFPQESRSLRSNQLCFKIMGRNGLILNHDFKEYLVILHVFFTIEETLFQIEEICDTPAELLGSQDTTCACFDTVWQTVGGKGADF
ncbi:hypothetical protein NKS27_13630 [Peribacillus frigoritolerans]|uniref:hypothetical protein n=1 Tax=Peribacillus frigoritolerans TaxID=450367 RepID=UPI0020A0473C|nr:hypothetical protein [Peribacillus frigoritolerans]MCP1153446.1 hypothetical protein [Peribacillus frigoritolerans]